MKSLLLFLFSIVFLHSIASTKVSLITCSAGTDVYSIFGHSALRVQDSIKGYDYVFNYGMFSFNTEHFLYKFVKGETYYWVGVDEFESFIRWYKREGRAVYENELLISETDVKRIQDFLVENIKPENSTYLYSYMFDNCATRIRDAIGANVGDSVVWHTTGEEYVEMPDKVDDSRFFKEYYSNQSDFTYRDLLNKYLSKITWIEWGIYFSVAAPSDKTIPYVHSMFLPEFLMMGFQNAYYYNNGEAKALVGEPNLIVKPTQKSVPTPELVSPLLLFAVLFILVALLVYGGLKKNRHYWGVDSVLLIIIGLLGTVGAFISWISIHPATFPNYNMLWASPFHLIAGILLFIPRYRKRIHPTVNKLFSILIVLYFILIVFQLQAFNWAFLPLILTLCLRYYIYNKVAIRV